VAACHAMHLLHSIAIQPNLELKTWPKQLLGYLPLDIALPDFYYGVVRFQKLNSVSQIIKSFLWSQNKRREKNLMSFW
jgi:hypothetical protein